MMRIAVFQRRAIFDDPERICAVLADDLARAEAARVDLALYPEAYLLGHSYNHDVIARRAALVTDRELNSVLARTRHIAIDVVLGPFEMRGEAIFNSAILLSRGTVLGRYAKAHPNEPGVTAGDAFPVFDLAATRYGINICNDANHPDAAARIAEQGATMILYPLNNMLPEQTADRWRTRSIDNLRGRAVQTGCWIASADVVGREGDIISHGCTMIIDPAGRIVARVPEAREGVMQFDIPPRPICPRRRGGLLPRALRARPCRRS